MKRCAILLLVLMGACATSNPSMTMQSWVGHHQSELYQAWGPPNQVTSDGNGGSILIYSGQVLTGQVPGEIQKNPTGGVSYTAPTQTGYQRTRMFYVDKDGKIYNWRWQGA